MKLTKNFAEIKSPNENINELIIQFESDMIDKSYDDLPKLGRKIIEGVLIDEYKYEHGSLYDKIKLYNDSYGTPIISDAFHMIRKFGNADVHFSNQTEKMTLTNALYIAKSVSFILQNTYLERKPAELIFSEAPYLPQTEVIKDTKESDVSIDNLSITSNELKIKKTLFINWFKNVNFKFIIPFYQREYSWDRDNLSTLLEDLRLRMEDRNQHYFGVIATRKILNKETDIIERKIIDGQQRITTALLFFKAAKDSLQNRNLKPIKILNEIFDDNAFKDKYQNDSVSKNANDELQRILTSDSYINDFEWNYGANYKFFFEELSKLEWEMVFEYVNIFAYKFEIAELVYEVETNREMDIFENMNSKGTDLEEWDLIRNQIFNSFNTSDIKDSQKVKMMDNKFIYEFNSNLKDSSETLSKFFTETIYIDLSLKNEKWVSFKKYPAYNNFKSLYKNLSITSEAGYKKLLGRFNSLGNIFKSLKLKSPLSISEQLAPVANRLVNLSNKQQTFATIMLLIEKNAEWTGSNWNIKNLDYVIDAIRLLDTVIMRIEISKGFGTSFRTDMLDFLIFFNEGKSIEEIKNFVRNSEKLYISNPVFEDALNSSMKHADGGRLLVELESYLLDKSGNANVSQKIKKPSVEHVMPQNNEKWISFMKEQSGSQWENFYEKSINILGNYYILPQSLNSKVKNSIFEEKKPELLKIKTALISGDNDLEIMPLFDVGSWSFDFIKKRTKILAKILLDEIYKY